MTVRRRWMVALLSGMVVVSGALANSASSDPVELPRPPARQPVQWTAQASSAPTPTAPTPAAQTPVVKPEPKAAPAKLSPALAELRDRLRRTVAVYYQQAPTTRDNTPDAIIDFCLAFGANAEVGQEGVPGNKINAVGCLCWNTPCAGYSLLQAGNGRVFARVGYGMEDRPGRFLAMLAQSRVPAGYEVRVGGERHTVADLVESAKRECRSGADLSLELLALSFYVTDDASWKSRFGETWSLARIVEQEIDREASQADPGTTDRLMGLSYAVDCHACRHHPIDGPYARALKHLTDCQEFALKIQNADGSWHPGFFAYRGTSSDVAGTLRSSGRILQWLVFSLPEDRLEEPRVVKAVGYVNGVLESWQGRFNTSYLPPRDLATVMRALCALQVYDQRVFKPHDPPKPNGKAATEAKTASRERP